MTQLFNEASLTQIGTCASRARTNKLNPQLNSHLNQAKVIVDLSLQAKVIVDLSLQAKSFLSSPTTINHQSLRFDREKPVPKIWAMKNMPTQELEFHIHKPLYYKHLLHGHEIPSRSLHIQ